MPVVTPSVMLPLVGNLNPFGGPHVVVPVLQHRARDIPAQIPDNTGGI